MKNTLKKRAAALAVIATLAVPAALSGCGGPAEPEGKYIPGTYTGESRGMGPISVTITVDKDGITSVDEVNGEGETPGRGGKEACEDGTFAAQIMEAQGDEIDGITGATLTTNGVKTAVAEALDQASNENK